MNATTFPKHKRLAEAKREGQPTSRGRFMRITDVIAATGLSRATIYRLLDADKFPPRVALTARCVGWWESQVEQWQEDRVPKIPTDA